MNKLILETIGWIGTSLILLDYFLLTMSYIESDSLSYQLINFLGALGLGINLVFKKAYPALTLQIIWGVIALIGVVSILTFAN